MEKEKKNGFGIFIVVLLLIFGFVVLVFDHNDSIQINDNNITQEIEDITGNYVVGEDETEDSEFVYDKIYTDKDVSSLIKKLESEYKLSEKKLSSDTVSLLKKIAQDVGEYESFLEPNYHMENPEDQVYFFALWLDGQGKEVPCEDGYACLSYTKKYIDTVSKYYNASKISDRFIKDENGNYIIKVEITGLDGDSVDKVYKTYKQGDNTILLVIYKHYDVDQYNNKVYIELTTRMHTFKQNNGTYYLYSSEIIKTDN